MKSLLACIVSFIFSIIVLYLFYSYVAIPVIPVFTLYIFMRLSEKLNCSNKYILGFFLLVISALSICIYSFQVYASIRYYPTYGNVLSIILDVITVLSFLSASVTFFSLLKE